MPVSADVAADVAAQVGGLQVDVDADVAGEVAAEVAVLPDQAGWRPRIATAPASSSATPLHSPSPAKNTCAMNR